MEWFNRLFRKNKSKKKMIKTLEKFDLIDKDAQVIPIKQGQNCLLGYGVKKDNLYRTKYGKYSSKELDAAIYSFVKATKISVNESGTTVVKMRKVALEIKDE